MSQETTAEQRDPDWLVAIKISDDERAYWDETCDVCPARPEYAVDIAMCREHTLSGVCFTCGSPLSDFGRTAGDYACEGLEDGDTEAAWRHEHGAYAHYEPELCPIDGSPVDGGGMCCLSHQPVDRGDWIAASNPVYGEVEC